MSESPELVPALFIGHGSPMNTLETNVFTQQWRELALMIGRPKAILALSAHWYVPATAVTSMENLRTIHDFSGFPRELSEFEYPAPGSPALASTVDETLSTQHVIQDDIQWGLDHGTWSVLAQMYPEAEIPVVQLSLNSTFSAAQHLDVGKALHGLRREGVLILCSGNVVHHLGMLDRSQHDGVYDWAQQFDSEVQRLMTSDPAALPQIIDHPEWLKAAPTPEHFIPLLYLAGVASESGASSEVVVEGGTMGSLTMTSFIVE
jgi:4,5-DOPA dioxygenase extradiol